MRQNSYKKSLKWIGKEFHSSPKNRRKTKKKKKTNRKKNLHLKLEGKQHQTNRNASPWIWTYYQREKTVHIVLHHQITLWIAATDNPDDR